jgi:porin
MNPSAQSLLVSRSVRAAWVIVASAALAASAPALGQTGGAPAASQPAAPEAASAPTSEPAYPAFFRLDYSGDFWHSPALTGDWGGARTKLAEKGISFNVETLNYIQGNAHGGASTNGAFRYGGSTDYFFQFDTYRMGLWPGGYIKVRGETRWGYGVTEQVGAISPPNFDTLLPAPQPNGVTTLTEYYMMQFLSEKLGVIAGQVDLSRLPGQNVFFSDPYSQFMNTAFWANMASFAVAPYSAMTAGFIYVPTEWLSGATIVVDSYGTPNVSGFESAFHSPQGEAIVQSLTFTIKPFGRDGHQRFGFGYSTREHIPLDDLDRVFLSGLVGPNFDRLNFPRSLRLGSRNFRLRGPYLRAVVSRLIEPEPTNSDNWAFWYDFDQYLYQTPDDPTQGFGLFGGIGITPGELFPISQMYMFGFGGKGVIPNRPGDRYGIGYYYMNLSDDIPELMGLSHEQGVEVFYNIEVTPWMHITPDLQVIIQPGGSDRNDVALVYGLRMHVSF